MSIGRVVLGFSLAPAALVSPFVLIGANEYIHGAAWERPNIAWFIAEMLGTAYGSAFLVGIPVHLFLQAKGRRALTDYLVATAIAALLASFLAAVFDKWIFPRNLEENPFGITMWSPFGITMTTGFVAAACFTAYVFWRIAIRQPSS